MGKLFAAAAVVAAPDLARATTSNEQPQRTENPAVDSKEVVEKKLDECIAYIERVVGDFSGPAVRENRTLAEEDALYEQLNAGIIFQDVPLREAVRKAVFGAQKIGAIEKLPHLASLLGEHGGFGWLCAGLRDAGVNTTAQIAESVAYAQARTHMYRSRAADYLPQGNEVNPGDIDPRVAQLSDPRYTDIRPIIEQTIQDTPAWSEQKNRLAFRALLSDETVRSALQKSNCTVAEAFSLVKAAVILEQKQPKRFSPEQRITWLLQRREWFNNQSLLHASTAEFIHYSFPAEGFDGEILDELGEGILADEQGVKRIDTPEFRDLFDTEDGPATLEQIDAANKMRGALTDAIAQSNGPTLLYLNTHGFSQGILLAPHSQMIFDELANALFARCQRLGATGLRDVKIVIDACLGHDLTGAIERHLADTFQAKGMRVATTAFPTVVAIAQAGSLGYSDVLNAALRKNKKAILREGRLTGAFLSRRIQPDAYDHSDMTFFDGDYGRMVEVGMQESARESAS